MTSRTPVSARTARSGRETKPLADENSLGQRAAQWLAASRQRIGLTLVACALLLLAYFVLFGRDGVATYMQKRREAQQLQQQLQTLQQENQQMTLHNQRLLNDPSAIEDAARRQLHYTRPGEVIYTLPEDPDAQPEAKPSQSKSLGLH